MEFSNFKQKISKMKLLGCMEDVEPLETFSRVCLCVCLNVSHRLLLSHAALGVTILFSMTFVL